MGLFFSFFSWFFLALFFFLKLGKFSARVLVTPNQSHHPPFEGMGFKDWYGLVQVALWELVRRWELRQKVGVRALVCAPSYLGLRGLMQGTACVCVGVRE